MTIFYLWFLKFLTKTKESGTLDYEFMFLRGFLMAYVVSWTSYDDSHGCLAAPHAINQGYCNDRYFPIGYSSRD